MLMELSAVVDGPPTPDVTDDDESSSGKDKGEVEEWDVKAKDMTPKDRALGATGRIKKIVKQVGQQAETAGQRALRVQEKMSHYNKGLKKLKKYLGKVRDSQYKYAMNIIDHFKEMESGRLT